MVSSRMRRSQCGPAWRLDAGRAGDAEPDAVGDAEEEIGDRAGDGAVAIAIVAHLRVHFQAVGQRQGQVEPLDGVELVVGDAAQPDEDAVGAMQPAGVLFGRQPQAR